MHSILPSVNALKQIVNRFIIKGEVKEILPYGSGHINDTYQVINTDASSPDYLLQCINSYVFKNIPLLISNIEIVTGHIKGKLNDNKASNPDKEVLTLIKTADKKAFFIDADGNYWRMYLFLKDTRSYDMVTTAQQAFEGGKAFGRFQSLLADLDAKLLGETIPEFHNIQDRLVKFETVLTNNTENRSANCVNEIIFLRERKKEMSMISELGRKGRLPLRITHNDTKFNNVLLTQNDQAQCVIDLDTVMPGYIAYDFGDAIRTIINTSTEDEADMSKIDINLSLYQAFTEGFLKETVRFLTEDEINSLPMGALLFPYMIGVRFLTDYLDGDRYFKIKFPDHNLQRARAQFQLLKKLEDNFLTLKSIVTQTAGKYNHPMLTNN